MYRAFCEAVHRVDPTLTVGGPATAFPLELDAPYREGFLEFVRTNDLPLDFFSFLWFTDGSRDPLDYRYVSEQLRALLDRYGFTDTDLTLSYWNYLAVPSSTAPAAEKGAFQAATAIYLQDTVIDHAFFFRADTGLDPHYGFVDPGGVGAADGSPDERSRALAMAGRALMGRRLAVTGGDESGTYNISTAAAIVVAACGVPVAKHGNKALSSKSGAADVLAALGVNLDADLGLVEKSIAEASIGFMMAPRHHSAMKYVGPARVEMGTRTLFNLLGPLSNPAGVKRQFTGVFAKDWVEPLAQVLNNLGCEAAWVVHGADGLDEMTTTGASFVAQLKDGEITTFEVTPDDAGLAEAKPEDLKGGDAATNAAALNAVLNGDPGPYRDVVVYNAAGALIVAGKAGDLKQGGALAAAAIDGGKAKESLENMIAISNEAGL